MVVSGRSYEMMGPCYLATSRLIRKEKYLATRITTNHPGECVDAISSFYLQAMKSPRDLIGQSKLTS